MEAVRSRFARLLLRSPVRLGSLRGVPVIGGWFHRLSRRLLPSEQRVWTQVRNGAARGIWLELNPRTGGDYAEGRAEALVQQALAEHLKPGMVFYDLGANIGLFSLLASRLVGDTGKVFSFEPDFVTVAGLRRNIEKNGATNVTVIEAGAGSSTGKFAFLPADSASPDRGLGKFVTTGEKSGSEHLQCYSLDDFAREFPRPDAIKCDVEGAEVEVIRGGQNLFKSCRPWVLIEIHSAGNREAVKSLCQSLGYKVNSVDEDHLLAEP